MNSDLEDSVTEIVKRSAEYISKNAGNVSINTDKIEDFAVNNIYPNLSNFPSWSACHFALKSHDEEAIIAYICVIDSLNFCFWPTTREQGGYEFEYGDLVNCLNNLLETNKDFYSARNLSQLKPEELQKNLFNHCPAVKDSNKEFPLLNERCRSLNEFGKFIVRQHNGSFTNLLKDNDNNLNLIMTDILRHVSTFRDESVYKGKQVFLYKRIQILAADLYSAMSEINVTIKGVEDLTMFPDYRVPQILCELGVIKYSDPLKSKIETFTEISPGSEEEIEIRGITIEIVEQIKKIIKLKYGKDVLSIHIDYYLWNEGEKMRKEIIPHHRTLTIFY